ncbi:MAG TPA: hypothetical protein DCY07_06695 [Rhodospirillaceae bacterium]|nr:hypothetical protein [Rhodospirillaceae bacterium]
MEKEQFDIKKSIDCLCIEIDAQQLNPRELAQRVTEVHESTVAASISALYDACARHLKTDDPNLYQAGLLIAQKLDADDKSLLHKNAFHNLEHLKIVILSSLVISKLAEKQGFNATCLDLLVAAMIHDADHDGATNIVDGKCIPFRLEEKAMAYAMPIFEETKVSQLTVGAIHYMLRWTDLAGRTADMKRNYPAGVSDEVEEKAKMLGDADLLFALGLGPKKAMNEDRKLNSELNRPFSRARFLSFINSIAPNGFFSKGAKFFDPNVKDLVIDLKSIPTKRYTANKAFGLYRPAAP